MQTAKQIIDKAGGSAKLAEMLKLPLGTVSAWGGRKIPARWAAPVAQIVGVEPHVIRPDIFPAPSAERRAQ